VVGAVAKTLTERIRATVEAPEGPVTSPAKVTEVLVELTTIFVRPAPFAEESADKPVVNICHRNDAVESVGAGKV